MTRQRGDRYSVHTTGDVEGQVVVGRDNTATLHRSGDTVDIEKLMGFATAVEQALPVLQLDAAQRERAHELTARIQQEAGRPAPDNGVLRACGESLRKVLESVGTSALTAGVLALWK